MINKSNNTLNEQKFQKALTIDAYRDFNKSNSMFTNWKKGKLILQAELKERLELEKEAANIMTNLIVMNLPKSMIKDLYHMWNEMMNRYNKLEKKETFTIIMNFSNMNRTSENFQGKEIIDSQNVVTSTARIKKNFSFSSSKSITDSNTMSIHHSVHRDSNQSNEDFNTDTMIDYPTAVSAQSSNKIKTK